MSDFVIINDLSLEEEGKLYKEFPPDINEYVKVADMVNANWQPFLNEKTYIGIAKSNDSISLLEAHDIGALGFESTPGDYLSSAYVVQDLCRVERRDLEVVDARFHNIPLTILETKRCIIREHSIEDFQAILDIYQDKSMTDYIEPLYDGEEEREYQKKYIDVVYKFYGYGLWLIVDKETGEVIGRAGVESKENCEDINQVELSYQVKKEYQNKGIATEVCKAIVNYTFEKLEKKSIIANVNEKNIPSIRIMEKLGFKPLGNEKYILRK